MRQQVNALRALKTERVSDARRASLRAIFADFGATISSHDSAFTTLRVHHQACERLIDLAWTTGFDDPWRALALARQAVECVGRLVDSESAYYKTLHARAWMHFGNASRIVADYGAAERAFRLAGYYLRGTDSVNDRVQFLVFKSILRGVQRDFDGALELVDTAFHELSQSSDLEAIGRVRVHKGAYLGESGRLDEAKVVLREAIAHLDPEQAPGLCLAARHNLAWVLIEAGEIGAARDLVEDARPLYYCVGNRMIVLRLHWLQGKLALSEGQLSEATNIFRAIRLEFLSEGLLDEVAQVSLDLAVAFLKQGLLSEVRTLALEMVGIFNSLDVTRDTYAALLLFVEAAQREQVTSTLIRDLAVRLKEPRKAYGKRAKSSV